ncbi:hydroxymethylglutaryl-CoA synthase [Epidermidibacterium keratini]|uniref:Hydroxymethylglutaryl-CoA synthase n=1 Tax=Epidermidibacterium keratini TaxID=1891644 RepID=A0A7L4YND0_9ACTN|nr:OB-fold domain-containing protein [Epidermidibacterium keratini]QHC00646.1 hydroxymethylglutaryl-CoA synthase [Epidermidibacterium keratini]
MSDRIGILSYASYLPHWRLRREAISGVLGSGGARGSRAVAGYDQDTTTMAVEAGRVALRGYDGSPAALVFSSSFPAYADKTNATTVHAALNLPSQVRASDACGSVRSAVGALLAGLHQPGGTLVTVADTRTGPAGSPDEAGGGDAAAAFVVGPGDPIAEVLAVGSATSEFLDRWRAPGEPWSQSWEERFGEDVYVGLAEQATERALELAGLRADQVDRWAMTGLSPRAVKRVSRSLELADGVLADDLSSQIGVAAAAHAGLLLADLLDQAQPGEVLALTVLADGADTFVLRAGEQITDHRQPEPVREQAARGDDSLSYADFLTWKGQLQRPAPRRPAPDRAVAPATYRHQDWKYGFVASTCEKCGTRHLPPQRVCLSCHSVDAMRAEPMADARARIATYTIDHLAFSLAPPTVGVVLDLDGGGRFSCELTDCDPEQVRVGQPVQLTFRRISDASGIHNYFWKARPAAEGETA